MPSLDAAHLVACCILDGCLSPLAHYVLLSVDRCGKRGSRQPPLDSEKN
jgi:hypothetical protein